MDEDDHLAPLMSHNWEPDAFVRSSLRKSQDLVDNIINRTDRLESDISNNNFKIEKLQNRLVLWSQIIFWLGIALVIIGMMMR